MRIRVVDKGKPSTIRIVDKSGTHNQASHGNWSLVGTDDKYEPYTIRVPSNPAGNTQSKTPDNIEGDKPSVIQKAKDFLNSERGKKLVQSGVAVLTAAVIGLLADQFTNDPLIDITGKAKKRKANAEETVKRGQQRIKDLGFDKEVETTVQEATAFETYQRYGMNPIAGYLLQSDEIIVPTSNSYWIDPAGNQEILRAQNYLSTSDPDHIYIHEYGHALHETPLLLGPLIESANVYNMDNYRLTKVWDVPEDKLAEVEREVSEYATVNLEETVAEMFTGMVVGKKYSESLMDLYKSYNGPEPSKKAKKSKDNSKRRLEGLFFVR